MIETRKPLILEDISENHKKGYEKKTVMLYKIQLGIKMQITFSVLSIQFFQFFNFPL